MLKRQYDKTNDIKYFNALSDIFIFSLQKTNYYLLENLSRIFKDAFSNERIIQQGRPVIYPLAYYTMIYKASEELSLQNSKRVEILESFTVGGLLLLGEFSVHELSGNTYHALWNSLKLAVKYDKDDMILAYWENANNYYKYAIGIINEEYGDFVEGKVKILNEIEVNKNKK